jgi:hypothetical protein
VTDYDAWQRANDEYLRAALASLRARLENLAPAAAVPAQSVAQSRAKPSFWSRLTGRRSKSQRSAATTALFPSGPGAAKAPVSELPERNAGAPAPALVLLSERFGLSRFEQDVLLLAVSVELDTRIGALCARAQDDPAQPYPTFALAMALFTEPSWDVLSPERPLRYWRLIEITQSGGRPLTVSALRADERVMNYVKGLNYLDDRLAPLVTPVPEVALQVDLPSSHAAILQRALDALRRASTAPRLPLIQLAGSDTPTKLLVAGRIAATLGLRVYRLSPEAMPTQATEVDTLVRLWDREAALLPLALYLDHPQGEGQGLDAVAAAIERFTVRTRSVVFVATREARPSQGAAAVVLDISRPSAAEQRAVWAALIGEAGAESAARLAGQFDLGLPAMHQVVAQATRDDATTNGTLDQRLWAACLEVTRPGLELLAQRIATRAEWGDLVLPPEQIATLKQLVAQVAQRSRVYDEWGFGRRMNRGFGISALFAGESGTGKTMGAEVIANDLRLNLYRIDLSAVVSKYIGETEKNLRRVFDAAEEGGAILLFDEADALFGKRSEVKDSHDRYANIEINYLLQRIEAYRGLAILTTNMKGAMDKAFLRRLRFVVDFPFPGAADRRRMWEQVFPPDADLARLDFDRLARLSLTGGSIHNVALNAAFHAAHAGEKVTMARVLGAAQTEFRKLERPINDADFRWLERAEGAA